MIKESVDTKPITKPDHRWVKYWAEIQFQKQLGRPSSEARRIAWERAFGKGGNENQEH
jgi:hypothetical protein